MPIHDWTRVRAGTFHFFHQRWISAICDALNLGGLPNGYFAMSEVDASGPIPDVLALKAQPSPPSEVPAGISLLETPPQTRVTSRGENSRGYARRADRVAIYLPQGELVAIVEIVSPGNKDGKNSIKAFCRKATTLLRRGVHLLVVDLFPPSVRDPQGIHPLIWSRFKEEPFEFPQGKPLTLAFYSAGEEKLAFVEPIGVGDSLIDMPIFLTPDRYVSCPLEATYQTTWAVFPDALKASL
jgi:hypothetical protein